VDTNDRSAATVTVYGADPHPVDGGDPTTFAPSGSPFRLGEPAVGSRIYFSCLLKGEKTKTAAVTVELSGRQNGRPVSWVSLWQPTCIPVGKDWRTASFEDFIPDEICRLKDLKASIMFSPFQSDLLFIKPKKALRSRLLVREARLRILAPLHICRGKPLIIL
jgi:hypothetical protein